MAWARHLVEHGMRSSSANMLGDTYTGSITANGNIQATATPLVSSFNSVTVVTAANNSVIMPVPETTPYSKIFVRNDDAADTLQVFPSVGASFNNQAVNAAIPILAGTAMWFCKAGTGKWITT